MSASARQGPVSQLLDLPARRRIVDLLANLPNQPEADGCLPGLTAAELAGELRLHVTTVRFHLDQLVEGRLLDSEFRAGRVGLPRKVYRFRPGSPAASTSEAYQALAALLAEAWASSHDAVPPSPERAGHQWALAAAGHGPVDPPARSAGTWLGKVGRVVDLLGRWGYTPELRTTDRGHTVELVLDGCPFLAVAQRRPEVVCAVHRGLLMGALESVGETEAEVQLRPFVSATRCQAVLTTRAAFD